jgi:hypothetical protein
VKSDPNEYRDVIKKLLEKTRQRKVDWGQAYSSSFRSTLSGGPEPFYFTVSLADRSNFGSGAFTLQMSDQRENVIFEVSTNDLPTSPAEEEISQMIEEIYDLARRQALKIGYKLEQASALLDQV